MGNRIYVTPIEEAYEIFEAARTRCSGLAKRARFVMSHATGKIGIVGLKEKHIFFKFLRAANEDNDARFMVFKCNPDAYWFDDYKERVDEYVPAVESAGIETIYY